MNSNASHHIQHHDRESNSPSDQQHHSTTISTSHSFFDEKIDPLIHQFMNACQDGDLPTVESLIDTHGSALSLIRDPIDHATALHRAAISQNAELVLLLISCGCQVSAVDGMGQTPLHYAAGSGSASLACLIGMRMEDADVRDKAGFTAFHLAVRRQHYHTAEIIRNQFDSDINSIAVDGLNALHYCCLRKEMEGIHYLLETEGIDINMPELRHGYTPLMFGVLAGHRNVIQRLLKDPSTEISAVDYSLQNIIFKVAQPLRHEMLSFLVELSEKYPQLKTISSCTDLTGRTPLHYAVERGDFLTVVGLLDLDANIYVNKRQAKGTSPFDIASSRLNLRAISDYMKANEIGKECAMMCIQRRNEATSM
eukprot:gb/GECH01014338.1/.p1 GENE.gb/GECH01014338.1/~~gb/GECH01014338.1/.p1  ORF type:complete len:367 (+),score=67.18 gb/GECH01014338.1/:1-1101(+)